MESGLIDPVAGFDPMKGLAAGDDGFYLQQVLAVTAQPKGRVRSMSLSRSPKPSQRH